MTYFIGNQMFNEFESCSVQEAYEYLKEQKVIAIDIETSRKYPKGTYKENVYKPGLDPHLSRIIMFQIGTLEKRYVIDTRVVDIKLLLKLLEDNSILKVGANLIFESLHFRHNYGINIRNLYDVLLVDRILTNGLYDSYSLEALMKRYRNYQSKGKTNLFGEIDTRIEIESLYNQKVETWIFLNGGITEDKEEELMSEAVEEVEGLSVDKSIRLEFVEWGDKPFRIDQVLYGETDIVEPLELRNLFLKGRKVYLGWDRETREDKWEQYYPESAVKMENRLIEVLCEMIYSGVCLDPIQWRELAKKKKELYYEKIQFLNDYVIDNHPEFRGALDMFTNKPDCMLKWTSTKQVKQLFDKLGLTVEARSKFTGKIEKTVGAKELIKSLSNTDKTRFADDNFPETIDTGSDLVVAYLLIKKLQQLHTTYGEQFLDYLHPITGRIHCNIRQYLNTTRMAATRPNMLAIPRGEEYRKCFVAPKGMKVWACDYSSQEIFTNAEVFNNPTLQQFFIDKITDPSKDMHSWMATKMYSIIYNNPNWVCDKKVHKKERQAAKIGGFSIVYGASGKAIADMLGVSVEEGEQFIINYFKALPGLEEEYVKAKKSAMTKGWIQIDPYTDKRYFYKDFDKMNQLRDSAMQYYPKDYYTYSSEEKRVFKERLYEDHPEVKGYWREWSILKGKLERRAVNFRVQGSAATQTKAALIYMWKEWNKDCYPALSIHDELLGYCKDEKDTERMKQLMIQGAQYICKRVPVFAEMETGNWWIH